MDNEPPKTVGQAAEYTGYHPKTILRALRDKELTGYQRGANCTWRIFPADLDAWLRGEKPKRRRRRAA